MGCVFSRVGLEGLLVVCREADLQKLEFGREFGGMNGFDHVKQCSGPTTSVGLEGS